jgi:predicted amidohydrolase YtcJ
VDTAEPHNPNWIVLAQRIHTLGGRSLRDGAIAISDGRIGALGTPRALLRARSRDTRVCDLGAAVLTPGLVDCHTHLLYWALSRNLIIDVSLLPTLNAVLQRIHTHARKMRLGDWVVARGFEHNRWTGGLPCAADLDRAVADRPALVRSRDGHTVWLNSAGLQRAGVRASTPDPPGGRYLRDAHGRPTGIVQETAIDALPDPLRELAQRTDVVALGIIDRALRNAYCEAWAHGIVGVHSMDDGPSLYHLGRQREQGSLGVRVVHAVQRRDLGAARAIGLRSGCGDEWLRVGGVKIFADGALGSQTAYMLKPYPGRGGFCGMPTLAEEELHATVRDAAQHGWAVWIHAIGDRAVREAIQAISAVRNKSGPALPHRIEHAQCVRPVDIRRMARAGIIASVQPCHILGDIPNADRYWPRARHAAFPLRRMLDAGITLAAGSDVPIETLDPRRSLFAATQRTDEQGQPRGGWFPAQRITALEALRAFTLGAAESIAGLNGPGTLVPGAPADLTIWDADPLATPPEQLLEIGIRGCMVGGRLHLTDPAA